MQESELQVGDIIFFENNYKGDIPYTYTDHVAVYAGLNERGEPTVLHSISSEYGHYHPEKLSGLCQTTLRQLNDQLQREEGSPDVRYDVKYFVYRCHDPDLASHAASVLENQSRYRIPYDESRLDEKLDLEKPKDDKPGFEDKDFCELAEGRYRERGLYRALKYAARLPGPMTRTRADGIGRGLTCSMAVTLAFQIAELMQQEKVRSIGELDSTKWLGDKYANLDLLPDDLAVPASYRAYLASLHKSAAAHRVDATTLPSILAWKGDDSPDDFTHETFAVDAKSIGAAGLRFYLDKQVLKAAESSEASELLAKKVEAAERLSGAASGGAGGRHAIDAASIASGASDATAAFSETTPPPSLWQSLGELNVPARSFSVEARVAERRRRSRSNSQARELLSLAVGGHPPLMSPSPSSDPSPGSSGFATRESFALSDGATKKWYESVPEVAEAAEAEDEPVTPVRKPAPATPVSRATSLPPPYVGGRSAFSGTPPRVLTLARSHSETHQPFPLSPPRGSAEVRADLRELARRQKELEAELAASKQEAHKPALPPVADAVGIIRAALSTAGGHPHRMIHKGSGRQSGGWLCHAAAGFFKTVCSFGYDVKDGDDDYDKATKASY